MKRTRSSWVVRGLVAALLLAIVGTIAWRPALRAVGALLIVSDPVQHVELAVMTSESGVDGALELATLFADHTVNRVGVMMPDPSPAQREIMRRGITLEYPPQILVKLGVPAAAIIAIAAREGGTTDATMELARWCAANGIHRVLVVTNPTHSRRVQRALRRAFKRAGPVILVRSPRTDPFHAWDWWETRATLRAGLVEIEKLLLDYVSHPFG